MPILPIILEKNRKQMCKSFPVRKIPVFFPPGFPNLCDMDVVDIVLGSGSYIKCWIETDYFGKGENVGQEALKAPTKALL